MKNLLKAVSIVMVIMGVALVVFGIVILVDERVIASYVETALTKLSDVTLAQNDAQLTAHVFTLVMGIALAVAGLIDTIVGLLGWRGAQGSKKMLIAAMIMVALAIVLAIYSLFTGVFHWTELITMIIPVIFLVGAIGTYRELE